MRQRRNSGRPAADKTRRSLELSPDRAFVLHLDIRARPPRHMMGRIEHITSGQVAHVTSLHALVAFMAQVLRKLPRGEHGAGYATLVQQPYDSDLAPSASDSLDDIAAGSAPPPTGRRGRKRGAE